MATDTHALAAHRAAHPQEGVREETAALRATLAARIAAHVGEAVEKTTAIPGLSFAQLFAPTTPSSYLYEPSLSLVVRGRKRVQLGGVTHVYDESTFLLTAVNLPTTTEVLEASLQQPYLSLLLRLDLDAARAWLPALEAGRQAGPGVAAAMATGPATADLVGAVSRLVGLLDRPQDLPHLGGLVMREIVYRLLTGPAGSGFRETILLGTRSQRTARAIAWLRENFAQPLRMEELAGLSCMAVSTLHHHFRAMTAMSPLQFQKHLRLHEARRLLVAEHVDAATAALRVGYESASQFNREYRRQFGAPPMRDVAALRRTCASADGT